MKGARYREVLRKVGVYHHVVLQAYQRVAPQVSSLEQPTSINDFPFTVVVLQDPCFPAHPWHIHVWFSGVLAVLVKRYPRHSVFHAKRDVLATNVSGRRIGHGVCTKIRFDTVTERIKFPQRR